MNQNDGCSATLAALRLIGALCGLVAAILYFITIFD